MTYRKELLESCRALDEGRGTIRELIEDALPVTEATCEALQAVCEQHREQRLQQLREEFEAARETWNFVVWERYDDFPVDEAAKDWPTYVWVHGSQGEAEWPIMQQAARRYIIARDFNEFDPKHADMLWKLANGGAL